VAVDPEWLSRGATAGAGADPGAAGPAVPAPPSRTRRLVRAGLVAAALVFIALAIRSQGHQIADSLARLSIGTVALAFAAVLGGLVAAAQSWRTLLAGLGSPLPPAVGGRVYLLAQLGKYLPGSLWPMLAQAELGRDHGVPRARSAVAAVAVLVVSLVTGAVVAVGCLALSATGAVRTYWYVGLVPLLGLVALSPPVLSRLLALAFRVLRRPGAQTTIAGGALLGSAIWSLVQWACFGVQTWLLARGLGGGHDRLLLLATGAFALAWVVGFLVVFVPAGVGAREAVLVLVLGPAVGNGNALALALVSRVLLIAGDLLTVAVAVVSARIYARHRPAPRPPDDPLSR
jgi:glycosyltransferase 2 family protein